jgi:hypothetical protein
MTSLRRLALVAPIAAGLLITDAAGAAETSFSYKTSYRNVTKDPDGIWSANDLTASGNGHVSIYEYQLKTPGAEWLISQIWNDDCSDATCPTRLVSVTDDGRRRVLVDDMMHQVIPPDDPRFASMAKSKEQAAFAQHPFRLEGDNKTLVNGDYKFAIGAKR